MSDTTQAVADLTGDSFVDPARTRIGFVARPAMVAALHGPGGDVTRCSSCSASS